MGRPQQYMVYFMENPMKMDDKLGVPVFYGGLHVIHGYLAMDSRSSHPALKNSVVFVAHFSTALPSVCQDGSKAPQICSPAKRSCGGCLGSLGDHESLIHPTRYTAMMHVTTGHITYRCTLYQCRYNSKNFCSY